MRNTAIKNTDGSALSSAGSGGKAFDSANVRCSCLLAFLKARGRPGRLPRVLAALFQQLRSPQVAA